MNGQHRSANLTATPSPLAQTGAALVVSLIILLVMTVIGVSAMKTTVLEEKMAANARQRQIAFQAAEAALRDAEDWIQTNISSISDLSSFDGNTSNLYSQTISVEGGIYAKATPAFDTTNPSDWLSNGKTIGTTLTSVSVQPRYIIEYLGRAGEPALEISTTQPDSRPHAFQITAIGWGQGSNPSAHYIVRSYYQLPLD